MRPGLTPSEGRAGVPPCRWPLRGGEGPCDRCLVDADQEIPDRLHFLGEVETAIRLDIKPLFGDLAQQKRPHNISYNVTHSFESPGME